MLDFQDWIERRFKSWGYRELAAAMLVVGLAFVLLDAMRWLSAPSSDQAAARNARVSIVRRWLHRDDARGFLSAAEIGNLGTDDKTYDIAWISGSPISIRKAPPEWRLESKKNAYDMTDVLARYLKSMDGRRIRVQEFLLQGVRTGDMRRAVLFAAAQPEIDAYIVEANSVWLLNDELQYTQSRQRAAVLSLPGATWRDYMVALRLLRPHEIGLEFVSAIVPAVRDRYSLFGRVTVPKAVAFPFRKTAAVVHDGAMLAKWREWFHPEVLAEPIDKGAANLMSYRNLMLMSDLTPSGFGMQTFVDNVRTLASTGKPVVIFLPPINPKLKKDPVTVRYVDAMVKALRSAFDQVGATNITFETDAIWSETDDTKFLDVMHLSHGQSVVDRVVGYLENRIGKKFVRRPLSEVYAPVPAPPAKASPGSAPQKPTQTAPAAVQPAEKAKTP